MASSTMRIYDGRPIPEMSYRREKLMEFRSVELRARNVSERIIGGIVVPYDRPAGIGDGVSETIAKGAFRATKPSDVTLRTEHNPATKDRGRVIGRGIKYVDEPNGAFMEFQVSRGKAGSDLLVDVEDGIARSFSVGFLPEAERWSADRRQVTRTRASLKEVSVVGSPAYESASITEMRRRTSAPAKRQPAPPRVPSRRSILLNRILDVEVEQTALRARSASTDDTHRRFMRTEWLSDWKGLQARLVTLEAGVKVRPQDRELRAVYGRVADRNNAHVHTLSHVRR